MSLTEIQRFEELKKKLEAFKTKAVQLEAEKGMLRTRLEELMNKITAFGIKPEEFKKELDELRAKVSQQVAQLETKIAEVENLGGQQ